MSERKRDLLPSVVWSPPAAAMAIPLIGNLQDFKRNDSGPQTQVMHHNIFVNLMSFNWKTRMFYIAEHLYECFQLVLPTVLRRTVLGILGPKPATV